jgi:hypothetical protein
MSIPDLLTGELIEDRWIFREDCGRLDHNLTAVSHFNTSTRIRFGLDLGLYDPV